MKQTKKTIALLFSIMLILSLCACGKNSSEYCGTYKAFGIAYQDHITALDEENQIEFTLDSDGTGTIKINSSGSESEAPIEAWKVENGTLTITVNNKDASGPIKNGVAELTIEDSDNPVYYAKEGADISSYDIR